MQKIKVLLAFALVVFLSGCSRQRSNSPSGKMNADTASPGIGGYSQTGRASAMDLAEPAPLDKTAPPPSASFSSPFLSSSAAVENNRDTTRKFIRTADLKFRAANVYQSTVEIESITAKHKGFVADTHLESHIDNVTSSPASADSLVETTFFTVSNTMTLRVPNTELDTTLKEITKNMEFLDYRTIKAEDVALQLLSNTLAQKRSAKTEERLTNAIDQKGKKLNETTTAEESVLNRQEQADSAKMANLYLTDQIKFSTIHLALYQRPSVKNEMIANDKNFAAYQPGFGAKMLDALKTGWDMIAAIFLFLIQCWALILIGGIIYLCFKKFGYKLRRLKKSKENSV